MLNTIKDTIMHPFIEATIVLTGLLDIKITKTGIRKLYLASYGQSPDISMGDFQDLLASLSIRTTFVKVLAQKLEKLSFPYMIKLIEDGDEHLYIATSKKDNIVTLYDSKMDMVRELDLSDKGMTDSYIVILINGYDLSYAENDYENKIAEQCAREAYYKKQIIHCNNFLTHEECDSIIDFCEKGNKFERSEVYIVEQSKGEISPARTSMSADLSDYPEITAIYSKICSLLLTDVDKIEALGCTKYHISNEFKFHFDSFDGGDRKRTIIIYLNEDFEGGRTCFRELDYEIVPKKGSCIIFHNEDASGAVIPESLHASLPVKKGIKYIIPVFEITNAQNRNVTNNSLSLYKNLPPR